jgi:hypothetical protein
MMLAKVKRNVMPEASCLLSSTVLDWNRITTKITLVVIPKVRNLVEHELRRLAEQDASGRTSKHETHTVSNY